jgi:hypothetical protein
MKHKHKNCNVMLPTHASNRSGLIVHTIRDSLCVRHATNAKTTMEKVPELTNYSARLQVDHVSIWGNCVSALPSN